MNKRKANRNMAISACRIIYGLLRDSERQIGEASQPQGSARARIASE
jgi:hypothetical protein